MSAETSRALGWVVARAADREAAGLRRRLRPRDLVGDSSLDLASNDYLDLTRHPLVAEAAVAAVRAWGAGATGSRLVTGSTRLHADLERELADLAGWEAGLVFSSGYLANLGALTALAGPGDLVVSDAGNHASIIDACRLTRARVAVVPHRDVAAVEAALVSRHEARAIVVTDAVFSVDGEAAPVSALYAVCRRRGVALVVDEAHSLGVIGRTGAGLVHEEGLAGRPDLVVTVTLSKALGSQGGAVLGSQAVVDHLVDAARTFIFDTGLAPASAGAALAAVRLLRAEPERADAVRGRAGDLAAAATELGLPVGVAPPAAAVTSVVVGEAEAAVRAARRCAELGIRVGCFRPPSVPDGRSRLRLAARAGLTVADVRRAAAALGEALVEPASSSSR